MNSSIYDPLGMTSPVVLAGRLLQRKFIPPKSNADNFYNYGWDDPLPEEYREEWDRSGTHILELKIPRCFHPSNFGEYDLELHVFADASQDAIGYIVYLRLVNYNSNVHVSFVFAKYALSLLMRLAGVGSL